MKPQHDDSPTYCVIVVIMGNGGRKIQNAYNHGYCAAADVTCNGGAKFEKIKFSFKVERRIRNQVWYGT